MAKSKVADRHRALGLPQGFCVAPFSTLLFEPDGKVGACRHKGSDFPIGNILHQDFDQIWNGEALQAWRKDFLSGSPKICETELRHRQCHLCPEYNSLLDRVEFSVVQSKMPSRISFNFNGHCNLECNMCYIWQKPNGIYEQIGFWEKLDDYIGNLSEVDLLSGEPFIQKDTYRLIDLISQKRPDCLWTFTTNANWKITPAVLQRLDQIKIKNIIISLDSLNESTYGMIRKKGNLKLALATTRQLQIYEEDRIKRGLTPLNIKVNFLIQQLNWRELKNIFEFGKNEKLSTFRTFLYEPSQLSILTLPESERSQIIEFYLEDLSAEALSHSMRVLLPILETLLPINRAWAFDQMKAKLSTSEDLRVLAEASI